VAKAEKKTKKAAVKKAGPKKAAAKKADVKKAAVKKTAVKKVGAKKRALVTTAAEAPPVRPVPPMALGGTSAVLDRLWGVVQARRNADPTVSHSARLLARGTAKVAQKFGEEAVECLIEATLRNPDGVVAESADVLYHLMVLWVDAGVRPEQVWAELKRREGVSGIAEKASRARNLPMQFGLKTSKIP